MVYKRVLFLSGSAYDTGVATYSIFLLDALEDSKEFLVVYYDSSWSSVLAKRDFSSMQFDISYGLFRILYIISKVLANKYVDKKLVSKLDVDNLSHIVFNTSSPVATILKGYRIVPIHDLMHKMYPEMLEFKNVFRRWYRNKLYADLCSQKDIVVVADSEVGREHIHRFYNAKCKVEVNYFPIPSLERSHGNSDEIENDRFFYYPAAFWEHKNHLFLLYAFKEFLKHNSGFKLIFSGPDRGCLFSVKELIEELSLQQNVSILPYVTEEKKIGLLSKSVALVFPSIFGPTNIPPLEAYSLGVNCVVADIFGAREQLNDYPFYFDIDSVESLSRALAYAAKNDEFRRDIFIENRLHFDQFKKRFIDLLENYTC